MSNRSEYFKAYYAANKDKMLQQFHNNYESNKEQLMIKHNEYRRTHPADRTRELTQVKCSCGSMISRLNIKRHQMTVKHIQIIEKIQKEKEAKQKEKEAKQEEKRRLKEEKTADNAAYRRVMKKLYKKIK